MIGFPDFILDPDRLDQRYEGVSCGPFISPILYGRQFASPGLELAAVFEIERERTKDTSDSKRK